jgi:peptidoglycan/LPS O-acetylase OafA/YrhL
MPQRSEPATAGASPAGRIVSIDVVRGFAILWVVSFHLWFDLRVPHTRTVAGTFAALPSSLMDHNAGSLLAVIDVLCRPGGFGVPLFMMLSGLSLTLVALRREGEHREGWRFFVRRFRRLIVPYWFGIGFSVLCFALIGVIQWARLGDAGITHYMFHTDVVIGTEQFHQAYSSPGRILASALVIPRVFRDDWRFAPEGALWFVGLIVQYYLLFPLLLRWLKRVGVTWFLVATLVVSLASSMVLIDVAAWLPEPGTLLAMGAPFRVFEFTLGMSCGYLIVREPDRMRGWVSSRVKAAACVVGGLMIFVCGCFIEATIFGGPAIVLGLTLVFVPLMCKRPGHIELMAPVRAVAMVGVLSYAVLIVNDPLRTVTELMRVDHASLPWFLVWTIAVYCPVTFLGALPVARFLGLMPRAGREVSGAPVTTEVAIAKVAV